MIGAVHAGSPFFGTPKLGSMNWEVPISGSLNWVYVQLGLFALAFGGLQVWWISNALQKGVKYLPRQAIRGLYEGEIGSPLA